MNLRSRIILAALAFVGLPFALPAKAHAACATIPYTFTNATGTYSTVDANTTNANNSALRACATNVDNTQIGTAGIFASQVIPTTVASATFGGTLNYTFPSTISLSGQSAQTLGVFGSGLNVNGVVCTSLGSYNGAGYPWCLDTNGNLGLAGGATISGATEIRGGYVSPVYNTSGGVVSSNEHVDFYAGTCAAATCTLPTITFSGSAVFTSATTYACQTLPQTFTGGSLNTLSWSNASGTSTSPQSTVATGTSSTTYYLVRCEGF